MKELVDTLRGAKTVAIVSHRDPDPDTIGSGIALGLALDSLGKRVTLHCADPVPEHARFLAWADRYSTEPPPATADLIVTVDFGSADRAKFALPAGPTLVNIDHHASNDRFGVGESRRRVFRRDRGARVARDRRARRRVDERTWRRRRSSGS